MARIRTVKPEIWTSEQFTECSVNARLLFIGLFNFCDDCGRHVASTKRLKMEVYPGDAFTDQQVNDWVGELISVGLMYAYEAQGKTYWQVTGWHHQKINRPQPSKIPAPLSEHSVNGQGARTDGREGKGREGKVSIKEDTNVSSSPPTKSWEGDKFPLSSGVLYALPLEVYERYKATYSWDVDAELRKIAQWCRDHKPERSKTGRGMQKRITSWLNRTDDKRGSPKTNQKRTQADLLRAIGCEVDDGE